MSESVNQSVRSLRNLNAFGALVSTLACALLFSISVPMHPEAKATPFDQDWRHRVSMGTANQAPNANQVYVEITNLTTQEVIPLGKSNVFMPPKSEGPLDFKISASYIKTVEPFISTSKSKSGVSKKEYEAVSLTVNSAPMAKLSHMQSGLFTNLSIQNNADRNLAWFVVDHITSDEKGHKKVVLRAGTIPQSVYDAMHRERKDDALRVFGGLLALLAGVAFSARVANDLDTVRDTYKNNLKAKKSQSSAL